MKFTMNHDAIEDGVTYLTVMSEEFTTDEFIMTIIFVSDTIAFSDMVADRLSRDSLVKISHESIAQSAVDWWKGNGSFEDTRKINFEVSS